MSNELTTTEKPVSPFDQVLANPDLLEKLDTDKLEKLFDLQERQLDRIAQQEYAAAFIAVQTAMSPVLKAKANSGAGGAKYATLADIARMLDPLLIQNGFATSLYSKKSPVDKMWTFYLDVTHTGGCSKQYTMDAPIDNLGPQGSPVKTALQGMGSSFTYCERFLLTKAFRVQLTDKLAPDNDGNDIKGAETITAAQLTSLEAGLGEIGRVTVDDIKGVLTWLDDAKSLATLNYAQYTKAMNYIKRELAKPKGEQ